MSEAKQQLDRFFDAMPNQTEIAPFDNERYCGLKVRWAEKGTGFGEFTVFCNKKTGRWKVDTESMGPTWCGRMLMRLVGTTVAGDKDDAART